MADPARKPSSARRYGARPTMKDVAARAGVGLKTVSRVVNGEPGVTPDTAQRVQAAIDALGFRRNDSARILRKGRTASIGLVLDDLGNPFYSSLSRAVEDVARTHGSLMFTGSSDEDPEREQDVSLAFCARRVDGLVIVPTAFDHGYLRPEIEAGIPAVFVDRPAERLGADAVLTDNAGGLGTAVAHLVGYGHQRIGFIGDQRRIHTASERLRGYREAMAAAGLAVDPSWVAMGPTSPERVRAELLRMLAPTEPITALLCGNNRVTVTALRVLASRRDPLALVGFDDFELADLLSPGVTVIAQDPGTMGETAAELLFRRLEGEAGPPQRIEIPGRLVVRGSGEIRP